MEPSLMYSPSAPIAVVLGNAAGSSPRTFAAMATAARKPEAVDSTYPSTPVICPAKKTAAKKPAAKKAAAKTAAAKKTTAKKTAAKKTTAKTKKENA